MNVCLATYQSISLLKGGPRTQILQTKKGLEGLGVGVSLYDAWEGFDPKRTDLVHLFGAHGGTYHFARELHKVGIPLAVTPIFFSRHSALTIRAGIMIDRFSRRALQRLIRTDYGLLAEICSWADLVLPNTIAEGSYIERAFGVPREKIRIIPNGVEGRFYHGDPALFRSKYNVENFVLNVGHIGPGRKNVLRLIQALENINVPSVIIGRIEQNEYGRACLERAKKNPRLLVLDVLPNESDLLASAYAASDVFALPSFFETPGIAALEAGLAGAKIVITKYGGTTEYFGEHADYVEPTSVELIQHGIVTALNHQKDNALREHIRQEYLWECIAEKTLRAYEQLLVSRC